MKKLFWIPILIIIIIIAGIILIIQNKDNQINKKQEMIKIGAILPLSGDLANFGSDVVKGMNLFSENHTQLKIIIEDDKGEAKESLNALKKLKDIDGATIFYGPFGPTLSETIYASQSELEKINLTFVAMSMCAEQFRTYENMLCNYPAPYYQLKESYKYPKSIDKESFYIILPNDAFGQEIFQMTSKIADELKLQLLGDSKVNIKDVDFYTTVDKAISKNPDFIMVATINPQTNFKIIKELKEKNYQGMIISGGDFEENLIKEFQDTLEGVYLTGQAKMEFDSNFLDLYAKKYGTGAPNLYQAYGYLWSQILYDLAQTKKHFTTDDIVNYVNAHTNSLAIKGIKYNSNKELEFPMKVLLVKNGQIQEVFVSK